MYHSPRYSPRFSPRYSPHHYPHWRHGLFPLPLFPVFRIPIRKKETPCSHRQKKKITAVISDGLM